MMKNQSSGKNDWQHSLLTKPRYDQIKKKDELINTVLSLKILATKRTPTP